MRQQDQNDLKNTLDKRSDSAAPSVEVVMVKNELRKTIQSRREARGLGSLEFDDQEETKTIELTSEEIQKINLRRERNRLSAQKCRKRRREEMNGLIQEATTIEEANQLLETEIASLENEKAELERMLREHCCHLKQAHSCNN